MKGEGYLYGSNCRSHSDYLTAKNFLNKWVSDSEISFQDCCYYLDNYDHVQHRGGHRYARPSYAFKFVLAKNKQFFHQPEMEYCYHGTKWQFLPSIIQKGLKIPNKQGFKPRNGSRYGQGIYSTKIPEYAQLYADPYKEGNKYFQVILLLRQDLKKIKCQGAVDFYGKFSSTISNQFINLKKIHFLHSKLMSKTDIQWVTEDESSVLIEAILVKVHHNDFKAQLQMLNGKIQQLSNPQQLSNTGNCIIM